MNLTDEQKKQSFEKLKDIAKKSGKNLNIWHDISQPDKIVITLKADNGVVHQEEKPDFTFDEYMAFINKAESVIMAKC